MEFEYIRIPKVESKQYTPQELAAKLASLLSQYAGYNKKIPQLLFGLLYDQYLSQSDAEKEEIRKVVADGNNVIKHGVELRKLLHSFDTTPTIYKGKVIQRIYYGTPGTGKSHTAKKVTKGQKIFRTTFHPDTDYASFVGAYKPKVVTGSVRNYKGKIVAGEIEKKIEYDYVPQIFIKAYCEAWKNYLNPEKDGNANLVIKPVCLLIEELNRGNCAQIFGDLFQLLDRTKKGFSEYSILADTDLAGYLKSVFRSELELYYKTIQENSDLDENNVPILPTWSEEKESSPMRLCLPPNLSIVCTMNTSDQSLFPMDSAFKRRWEWEYVPVDYCCNKSSFTIVIDGTHEYSWNSFLEKINSIIYEQTKSEDKQMGNFFVKGDEHLKVDREQFISKVMYFLWSEICKDNPKARKAIFVERIKADTDGTTEDKDFTFNNLFSSDCGVNKLIGFMNFMGIENIANSIHSSTPNKTQNTTEE